MKHVSWSNVAGAIVFLLIGLYAAPQREPEVITRTDTVAPQAMKDSLARVTLSAEGWKAKAAGRERVLSSTILVTDTLVTPPDTVLQLVSVRDQTLTVAPLIKGGRTDSLYKPELHRFDVGGCDDGFSWAAGELVCDRARFGHLSLFAEAGMAGHPFVPMPDLTYRAEAGLEWIPSYRSGWRASVGLDPDGLVALTVTRKWSVW